MSDENQPLDNEPQENDDAFGDAFDEYASGTNDRDSHDTPPDEGREEVDRDDSRGGEGEEPQLTAREQEMQQQLQRLQHSDASQRGRLGAYQRQINELQRQLQERQQAPQQQAQQRQNAGQGSSDDDQQRQDMAEQMGMDDWETFKEDFPDMARAFEARLQADRQEVAQLRNQLAQHEPALQSIQQQAQEKHLKAQEDALQARHSDWREVVAAPEFAEWLNQQPESMQRLKDSNDAAEAAALLSAYKGDTGYAGAGSRTGTPDKRQQRLASAQSVPRRGAPRHGQVDDDFGAAFDHYAANKARNR